MPKWFRKKEREETEGVESDIKALDKQVEIFRGAEEKILGRGRISAKKCSGAEAEQSY